MTQNNCCCLLSNNYWSCCAAIARNTIFDHSSCFITSGSVRTDFPTGLRFYECSFN